MEHKMKKTPFAFGALVVAAIFVGPARAQIVAGAPYEELRVSLLAKGWKPDTSYGPKMANGKALYHQPEILCGPEICRAKWRDPQGHEQQILLNRGVNKDHTVAQQ
jgi:hypothetical protein